MCVPLSRFSPAQGMPSALAYLALHSLALCPRIPLARSLAWSLPSLSRRAGDGLQLAFKTLLPAYLQHRNKAQYRVWLFTDGINNYPPRNPMGFDASLRDYEREADGFLPTVDVFGFGPNVIVDILDGEIARTTGGLYGSIYSSTEIATNLVNAAAAWASVDEAPVALTAVDEAWRLQSVAFLRQVASEAKFATEAQCNKFVERVQAHAAAMTAAGVSAPFVADFVGAGSKDGQVQLAVSTPEIVRKWGRHFLLSLASAHAIQRCAQFHAPGLQVYATGGFREAQSRITTLFMDRMREYDAALDARDAERVRATEQARLEALRNGARVLPPVYVPTVRASSSTLFDPHGGCIDGECSAVAADDSIVLIKNIQVGDWMRPAVGEAPVQVTHVVRTRPSPTTPAVRFQGGLVLTAFHPILPPPRPCNDPGAANAAAAAAAAAAAPNAAAWAFPQDVQEGIVCKGTAATVGLGHMYSFGVKAPFKQASECFGLVVNGTGVATLGHEVQDNAVLRHAFWGSAIVLQRISAMNAWAARHNLSAKDNVVNVNGWAWTCDARTGLSNGLSALNED